MERIVPARFAHVSRDVWLALGLLLLLVGALGVSVIQDSQPESPPLYSLSSAPNGAQALYTWLATLDKPVTNVSLVSFHPPEDAGMTLILHPTVPVLDQEWELLDEWVSAGGTLLIAGNSSAALFAFRHYDFDAELLTTDERSPTLHNPLFASPPLTELPAQLRTAWVLVPERDDFVTHLTLNNQPVIVSFAQEQGQLILSTAVFPFTNAGLKSAGNSELVLNLLSPRNRHATIWFDEWHHGIRAQTNIGSGPMDWLRYHPIGRALLYSAGIILIGLLLSGRRLGPALPLAHETSRRAPLEYITGIANLSRRAGHRYAVQQEYRQRLKRELGSRYRLDPTLPDEQYLQQLAAYDSPFDLPKTSYLLQRLQSPNVSEQELVFLANQVLDCLARGK